MASSSEATSSRPLAAILGCSGPRLTGEERGFFAAANPFGFILFARNIKDPEQVRGLTADLRASVGRADVPILIDQEGGRVRRLRPPMWRESPPMRPFGELYIRDPNAARRALELNVRLLARELVDLGINVDCAPILDVPIPGSHDIIGDRAFAFSPDVVADLGRVAHDAFLAEGVYPVIKHIPGHGRSMADSHFDLPVVAAGLEDLQGSDFIPFTALKDAPFAMTAHIIYDKIDAERTATLSPAVVQGVIRDLIGFEGLLMTDDVSMKALSGPMEERARNSLAAGCDLVLHCNGDMAEMQAVVAGSSPLDDAAAWRWERVQRMPGRPGDMDVANAEAELFRLMA